ncbi:lysophosphatidic acid receptor 4-like [Neosynchiropus ocellatus]
MENMTGSEADKVEPRLAYAVVYGGVLVLGLPLNAVSLWILWRRHSHKSPSAVFMVNLALSDLLLVVSLPLNIYFHATGVWPLGNLPCICAVVLFRNNIRSSSVFITLISVDRLLAVVFPLRSRHSRTASNAWKAAALTWISLIAVNVPEGFSLHRHSDSFNDTICSRVIDRHLLHRSAVENFQPVFVFLLLLVNIVSTVSVIWALCRRPKDSPVITNKANIVLVFLMNLIVFSGCFLPVSVAVFTMTTSQIQPLVCLAAVNCCLDPPLYYFSMDNFWKKDPEGSRTRGEEATELRGTTVCDH